MTSFKEYLIQIDEAKKDIEVSGIMGNSIIKGSKSAVLSEKEVQQAQSLGLKPFKWDDGQYTSGPFMIWKKIFGTKNFDPEKTFSIPFEITSEKVIRGKVEVDNRAGEGWNVTVSYKLASKTIREKFEVQPDSIKKIS